MGSSCCSHQLDSSGEIEDTMTTRKCADEGHEEREREWVGARATERERRYRARARENQPGIPRAIPPTARARTRGVENSFAGRRGLGPALRIASSRAGALTRRPFHPLSLIDTRRLKRNRPETQQTQARTRECRTRTCRQAQEAPRWKR